MAKCMFCQERTANSKEHVFGRWWKNHFPDDGLPSNSKMHHLVSSTSSEGVYSRSVGRFGLVDRGHQAAYKVVCSKCNSTWMNKIELGMQDAYLSIYVNGFPNISSQQSVSIRNWVFLKGLIHDRSLQIEPNDSDNGYFNGDLKFEVKNERSKIWKRFHENNSVPTGFRTFIFQDSHEKSYCANFLNNSKISHMSIPPVFYNNVSYFALGIGNFSGIQTNIPLAIELLDSATDLYQTPINGPNPTRYLRNFKKSITDVDKLVCGVLRDSGIKIFDRFDDRDVEDAKREQFEKYIKGFLDSK